MPYDDVPRLKPAENLEKLKAPQTIFLYDFCVHFYGREMLAELMILSIILSGLF